MEKQRVRTITDTDDRTIFPIVAVPMHKTSSVQLKKRISLIPSLPSVHIPRASTLFIDLETVLNLKYSKLLFRIDSAYHLYARS